MIPFPNKKYSVIYADPPWSYQDKRCNGNAADHYPTLLRQIYGDSEFVPFEERYPAIKQRKYK